MNLAITNVINVSVATPQPGVGQYNTSNVAFLTRDAYADSFGSLGYKIYLSPTEVATDFGTNSDTYKMAVSLFAQQPNILANNGYLVIIPYLTDPQTAVQTITFPKVPVSGTFVLNHGVDATSTLNWNDSAATIQTALRALPGFSTIVVTGSIAGQLLTVTFTGVSGPVTNLTVSANTLVDADSDAVTPVIATTVIGSTAETMDQAILRTQDLVQYFAVMSVEQEIETVMLAAAGVVQGLNKLALFVSNDSASVAPGGLLDLLRTGFYTHSRGLYYGDTNSLALSFMAAYAGRGFSTNFSGSNTTQTMHLKTLSNVQPDPSMTQTLLNQCQAAGVDVYVSIQGVPKTFTSGANDFFDNVYNLQWFVGAIQVAGFNVLATTPTKIPQTENGMNILKGAMRKVCEQAGNNQFIAPGEWTSPVTFGNQGDLLANIQQRGYYIYSNPVSQQSPDDRALRVAPLIQIAIKYAGAIHRVDVIVYVNP